MVTAAFLAAGSSAFAASIVASKHNLSLATANLAGKTNATSTQICIYCHAPHNAVNPSLLWNRNAVVVAADFRLYSGANMANISYKTGFTADSTSLFCMSCHDGQTSMESVANQPKVGALAIGTVTGAAAIAGVSGTNLANTHPINFPVLSNSQNDLNFASATPTFGEGRMGTTGQFPLFKSTDAGAGRTTGTQSLECGSCHSVHDPANVPFLRDTMTGSTLCLGCHNK
jgi:predicted CXXCH cytochrome family protein